MKKAITLFALSGVVALALATGAVSTTFTQKYNVKPASKLGQAKCGVCHVKATGGALNKYGKDVQGAKVGGKITAASFANVEGKDSDGDGKNNGAEIKADTLPGA